jgi:hypothetical protein
MTRFYRLAWPGSRRTQLVETSRESTGRPGRSFCWHSPVTRSEIGPPHGPRSTHAAAWPLPRSLTGTPLTRTWYLPVSPQLNGVNTSPLWPNILPSFCQALLRSLGRVQCLAAIGNCIEAGTQSLSSFARECSPSGRGNRKCRPLKSAPVIC